MKIELYSLERNDAEKKAITGYSYSPVYTETVVWDHVPRVGDNILFPQADYFKRVIAVSWRSTSVRLLCEFEHATKNVEGLYQF